jgi:uncharacterized protein (TIGR03790 family)
VRTPSLVVLLTLLACNSDPDDDTTAATTTHPGTTSTAPTTSAETTADPPPPTTTTTTTTTPTTDDEDDDDTTPPDTTTTTDPPTSSSSTTSDEPLAPTVLLPRASIQPSELVILANDQDPQSMAVAAYYQQQRAIPPENLLTFSFPPANGITAAAFAPLKAQVDALPPTIHALAIAWTTPYLVDCQSLASALALGHDPAKYCSTPCSVTVASGFYDSPSLAPYTDHGLRLAMHLAGTSVENVQALIDRGVAADGTYPTGVGYFLRTTDPARSVRWPEFMATQGVWDHPGGLDIEYIDNSMGAGSDFITGKTDVLFYLTGLASVPEIATNTYLPGAVADHLTSYGGQIPDSGQMSIVRWLEAGATASYGTSTEPCNYNTKFPASAPLLAHYYRGETVIEAYWKSVDWPGEGVFVGEPLARPWGGAIITWEPPSLTIATTQLVPGALYDLESGPTADGPWTIVQPAISVPDHQLAQILVADAPAPFYRLVPAP